MQVKVESSLVFLAAFSIWLFAPLAVVISFLPSPAALIVNLIWFVCAICLAAWVAENVPLVSKVAVSLLGFCSGLGPLDFMVYFIGFPFMFAIEAAIAIDVLFPKEHKVAFRVGALFLGACVFGLLFWQASKSNSNLGVRAQAIQASKAKQK